MMGNGHFDIRTMNRDAYEKVQKVHGEIEEELASGNPDGDRLMRLYMRELNDSMFLNGIYTRNYGPDMPY